MSRKEPLIIELDGEEYFIPANPPKKLMKFAFSQKALGNKRMSKGKDHQFKILLFGKPLWEKIQSLQVTDESLVDVGSIIAAIFKHWGFGPPEIN